MEILHHAAETPTAPFSCYLRPDSALPMMMLDDCVHAIVNFMAAEDSKLTQRTYNLSAVSFTPDEMTAEIAKHIPGFHTVYDVDPVRQRIADSWPNSFDDSVARQDWGWQHEYGLEEIVKYSLASLAKQKADEPIAEM